MTPGQAALAVLVAILGLLAGTGWAAARHWRREATRRRREALALRVRLDEVQGQLACADQHRHALLVALGRRQERAEGLRDIALQAATLARLPGLQKSGPHDGGPEG